MDIFLVSLSNLNVNLLTLWNFLLKQTFFFSNAIFQAKHSEPFMGLLCKIYLITVSQTTIVISSAMKFLFEKKLQ